MHIFFDEFRLNMLNYFAGNFCNGKLRNEEIIKKWDYF